jgi:Flp pilus assembly protein TadG
MQPNTSGRMGRRRSRQGGNSLIELALTMTFLMLVVLGTVDFARLFYAAIEVNDAARAGAQYGSQSVVTAADSTGMVNAAKANATNVTGVTANATQCTCNSGSSVTACSTSYCTNNPKGNFVTVNTQLTFTTVAPYPGIPSSVALSGKSVMEVGQ